MNRASVLELARAEVRALSTYGPPTQPCAVDLSDNVNLWGTSPAVLSAVQRSTVAAISQYPSTYSEPLDSLLLHYVGFRAADDIDAVVGCGSDDVIDATMRAFGGTNGSIAYSSPTFSMIPVFARLNGLNAIPIPLRETYDVDAQRLVDAHASITYLCSPNNPTGTWISREAVEYVIQHAHGIVLLDEAYAEFAAANFADVVTTSDRVLVTRTFSKAFGLAGLRAGFAFGAQELVQMVERARGPYKLNAIAECAVQAALSAAGLAWVRDHAALVMEYRQRLADELRELGLTPMPSAGNFLFVPTPDARTMFQALADRGVLVRLQRNLPQDLSALRESNGLALRIGVGPWEMMETLLAAFREGVACA